MFVLNSEAIKRDWLVAGFTHGQAFSGDSSVETLVDLAANNIDVFMVLDTEARAAANLVLPQVMDEFSPGTSTLIFLLPWQVSPKTHVRYDGLVHSFVCSASLLRSLMRTHNDLQIKKLSFDLLRGLADGELEVDKLLVRQFSCANRLSLSPGDSLPAAVIMAHRGKPGHLETALRYLNRINGGKFNIRVGLDVDEPRDYENLRFAYPDVEFYCARPGGLGPYVIRDELTDRSPEALFLFHDSDDLSCVDRFPTLCAGMSTSGCDLIGSHELRLDEMCGEVCALRFPLDVSDALRQEIAHPLQHAASMVRRDAFRNSGGFSTDRRTSNDTQFLLRAYFSMSIRNVDEFVYVRRKHAESLTEAIDTGMHMPFRRRLRQIWSNDFLAIQRGELRLNDSSLRRLEGATAYKFERLSAKRESSETAATGGHA